MKIVLATGGFDPLHSGHISYLKSARELGDKLIVGLNSDDWLTRKKGRPFMPYKERAAIVENLKMVDEVIDFNDKEDHATDAIFKIYRKMKPHDILIFANGGDRTATNIPEMDCFQNNTNVRYMFGVGGDDKKNSSSWILEEWKDPKTVRNWGWYRVLDDKPGVKAKELVIEPGHSLSNQRHFKRAEHWYVLQGSVNIEIEDTENHKQTVNLTSHETFVIQPLTWHKAQNLTKEHTHILEVQYGEECIEEDIERKD